MQQQAALMAAAQGTAYMSPMAALAAHPAINGIETNAVVPPTSGISLLYLFTKLYNRFRCFWNLFID